MTNYFNLHGKVALITGASSGLGAHFAKVLATEGAQVVLAARRAEKLADQVAAINASGGHAWAVPMDVTSSASVTQAFQVIAEQVGTLDILINNAGIADEPRKFLDTEEDIWLETLDTNLNGAWRVAKAAAAMMVGNQTAGAIVNIASIYGLKTGALKAPYNVSKAGVVQLTKAMAVELCRHQIRVNALCPGWFKTDLNKAYFDSDKGSAYIKGIPARRLGNLDDLSVPLLMLASNSAGGYITGSCVTVDGGIAETPI